MIAHVGEEQAILVDLLRAIKVLPTDTLMQTIRQVIKQPPPTNQDRNKVKNFASRDLDFLHKRNLRLQISKFKIKVFVVKDSLFVIIEENTIGS